MGDTTGIQLTLTKEQATLLTPILQQILLPPKLGEDANRNGEGSRCHSGSLFSPASARDDVHVLELNCVQLADKKEPTPDSKNIDENGDKCQTDSAEGIDHFTVKELLDKTQKNQKSTRAQNFLNVR